MKSCLLILVLGSFCQFCYYESKKEGRRAHRPKRSCGDEDDYHSGPRYPRTEEQLIQEIKTDLNALERNPKANRDTPAVADIWDLINTSKYIGTPAFTELIIELDKASERVLNLLREYYPRARSLRHMRLISAMKDLLKTFSHQAAIHPNKGQKSQRDFLNFRM